MSHRYLGAPVCDDWTPEETKPRNKRNRRNIIASPSLKQRLFGRDPRAPKTERSEGRLVIQKTKTQAPAIDGTRVTNDSQRAVENRTLSANSKHKEAR